MDMDGFRDGFRDGFLDGYGWIKAGLDERQLVIMGTRNLAPGCD